MLVDLRAIESIQASPTEATMYKEKYFLDYAASHPEAILSYSASDMFLEAHSNAFYLTEPKARSIACGNFHVEQCSKPIKQWSSLDHFTNN